MASALVGTPHRPDKWLRDKLIGEASQGCLFAAEDLLALGMSCEEIQPRSDQGTQDVGKLLSMAQVERLTHFHLLAFIQDEQAMETIIKVNAPDMVGMESLCRSPSHRYAPGLDYGFLYRGTAFHLATARSILRPVEILLREGANPYTANERGRTPWCLAVMAKNVTIARLFKDSKHALPRKKLQPLTETALSISTIWNLVTYGANHAKRTVDMICYLQSCGLVQKLGSYEVVMASWAANPKALEILLRETHTEEAEVALKSLLLLATASQEPEAVKAVLSHIPRLQMKPDTYFILKMMMAMPGPSSAAIFTMALEHLDSRFDLNAKFTNGNPTTIGRGLTLLH